MPERTFDRMIIPGRVRTDFVVETKERSLLLSLLHVFGRDLCAPTDGDLFKTPREGTESNPPPCLGPTVLRNQVYFVVALFRTAEPSVLDAASRGLDLTALLGRGEALESFDLGESLHFMEGLETRHRKRCLAATRAYLAQ